MATVTKVIGGIRIEDNTSMWLTTYGVTSYNYELVLTPGVYYALGDGTDEDLCKLLTDSWDASGLPVGWVDWGVTVDYKRLQVISLTSGTIEISFSSVSTPTADDSIYLQDIFGFGTTVTIQGGETLISDKPFYGVFAPATYLMRDEEGFESYKVMWEEPQGTVGTLSTGGRNDITIKLRSIGTPYGDSDWNEYHELLWLIRVGMTGLPLRLYRQADLSTAFDLDSNQMGYVDFYLKQSNIAIESANPDWYKIQDAVLKGWMVAEGGATYDNLY